MRTINKIQQSNKLIRKWILISQSVLLLLSLMLVPCTAQAEYAEDACRQFDGYGQCEKPLNPVATSAFFYVMSAGDWGTVYGTGTTAQQAASGYNGAIAGPNPPLDCTNCDAWGQGTAKSPLLGRTGSSIWWSADDIYSFANFESYLPYTLIIPVRDAYGWYSAASVTGSRNITPFRCPANTTRVDARDPNRVKSPFMCKLPPEPKRCPTPPNKNNPFKTTCGNPVDFVSGNKIQTETDWTAANGPLRVSRIYNSQPENPIIIENTNFNTANWQFNYDKRISLQFNQYNTGDLVLSNETSAQKLFAASAQDYNWQNRPSAFYPIIKIKRPGGNTQTAYFDNVTPNPNGGAAKITFKLDQNGSGISVDAFPDGSWLYRHSIAGTSEVYNALGQLTRINYRNGQFVTLSYSSANLLVKVTDQFGRYLQYGYDSAGRISQITLPNNTQLTYGYDAQSRLSSVTKPGYGAKTYLYNENTTLAPSGNANLLTGIVDEKGGRFGTYTYDASDRAVSTEHAGGAEKYTVNYGMVGQRVVTDVLGRVSTYTLQTVQGYDTPKSLTEPNQAAANLQFDQRGNVTSINKDGRITTFSYDPALNRETSRTEAVGTPQQRTINTQWHASLPVPLKITEKDASGTSLRETTYSYDANGNVLSKTINDVQASPVVSRTWSYTYNSVGQLLSATTPAGETSTNTYNTSNGNLLTSSNALGQITTYSNHDMDGRPWKIVYPSGHQVELVYDTAGHITQQTETTFNPSISDVNSTDGNGNKWIEWPQWLVDMINNWCQMLGLNSPFTGNKTVASGKYSRLYNPASQQAITKYYYDAVGQLIQVQLPLGKILQYQYDDAHRLIKATDEHGISFNYTMDAAGNITTTESPATSNSLLQKTRQVYDTLGRLQQTLGNNGQSQTNSYDEFNNLTSSVDNLGRTSQSSYDGLDRKVSDTDPLNQTTAYEYNALDQLKKVTDPRNVSTSYSSNAFGETTQQTSPDTGNTSYQYTNGRLTQSTDANSILHQYQYDALGRLTSRTDGSDSTSYSYDQGTYGAGYLATAKNSNTEIRYTRDSAGRVLEKVIAIKNKQPLRVRYAYTSQGQLQSMVLPSGNWVDYSVANSGDVSDITWYAPGAYGKMLLTQARYGANGIESWMWGNNERAVNYKRDSDGRMVLVESHSPYLSSSSPIPGDGLFRQYSYDGGNRISSITDIAAGIGTQGYSHDLLDRLTKQTLSNQTLEYAYDTNGNRTQLKKTAGSSVTTTAYSIGSGNNRINTTTTGSSSKSYQYLPTGQVTSDGERTFEYDSQGRSYRIQKGSVGIVNLYDPKGQRIQKNSSSLTTYFVYDEEGKLLGEYDGNGSMLREYIWLKDRVVGMLSYQYPGQILWVHTDHLGTPRAVSNASSWVVWKWDGDQFGDVLPTGNLIMPLRHAGQYYDSEVGTFYNYFRDYDPSTGRYLQSDPIGLDGGLNTYGYVGGNPLLLNDPTGEAAQALALAPLGAAIGAGAACYITQCGEIIPTAVDAAKDAWDKLAKGMAASGNQADSAIQYAHSQECNKSDDRCEWLKRNAHRFPPAAVKATEKAWGCRHSRVSKDKKK